MASGAGSAAFEVRARLDAALAELAAFSALVLAGDLLPEPRRPSNGVRVDGGAGASGSGAAANGPADDTTGGAAAL